MKNETKKMTVIATTQTFFKIAIPILYGFLVALIVVCVIFIPEMLFMLVPLLAVIGAMFILALLNPINAIVYDEEKQEFTIRAAQTFITNFKRRYVKLSDIERVVGYPTSIWIPSSRDGLFIFIKGNNRPMSIRTINRPEVAAEKINMIIMQAAVMQEIARKNQAAEN